MTAVVRCFCQTRFYSLPSCNWSSKWWSHDCCRELFCQTRFCSLPSRMRAMDHRPRLRSPLCSCFCSCTLSFLFWSFNCTSPALHYQLIVRFHMIDWLLFLFCSLICPYLCQSSFFCRQVDAIIVVVAILSISFCCCSWVTTFFYTFNWLMCRCHCPKVFVSFIAWRVNSNRKTISGPYFLPKTLA